MFSKLIKGLLFLLVILILALVAIPYLFKDKIVQFAKTQLNENVNAIVDFSDIDLSLIKSFPNLNVAIQDLKVTGVQEFRKDTLAAIKSLQATVDLNTLFDLSDIELKKIRVVEPHIYAHVLKNGKANWDIALPSTETTSSKESSPYKVAIQKYSVEKGKVVYKDESSKIHAAIYGLNHEGTGDFSQDEFVLKTNTSIASLNTVMDGISYFKKVKTDADIDIDINNKTGKYTLKNNTVKLNALELAWNGWVQMPPNSDDIKMDLKLASKESEFKNILSLIPSAFTEDFKNVKSEGKMALKGSFKGTYSDKTLPAYSIDLDVIDGMFKYPDLSQSVNDIDVDMKIDSPDGDLNKTLVDISNFSFLLDGQPFEMKANIKEVFGDPLLDVEAKGKLDLNKLMQSYPLEDVKVLKGMVDMDILAKGKMSAIEENKYNEFDLRGTASATNLEYDAKDLPKKVNLSKAAFQFSPKAVLVRQLDGQVGKTDFKVKGSVTQFLPYLFADGTLKGEVDIVSSLLDCNEWLTETVVEESPQPGSKKEPEASTSEVFLVPENIDIRIGTSVGKLIYDDITFNDFAGTVVVKDETLQLKNVKASGLGGKMLMNGTYSTSGKGAPTVDIDYDIQEMDIVQAFNAFNSFEKLAPVAQFIKGNFSSKLHFDGELGNDMMPNLMTFSGNGAAAMLEATLANFEPLTAIGNALQIDKLKRIEILDLKTKFDVKEGRVYVNPFQIKPLDMVLDIAGSHGFDQSLDYDIVAEVPSSMFGSQANTLMDKLLAQAADKGVNLEVPQTIKLNLKLGGTISKPKIETNLKDAIAGKGQDLLDQAKDALNNAKDQVVDKANEVKDAAQSAVNEQVDNVKSEAQQIKNEALGTLGQGTDSIKNYIGTKAGNIGKGVAVGGTKSVKSAADSIKNAVKGTSIKDVKGKAGNAIKGLFGKGKKKD